MTTRELIEALKARGIEYSRKALYEDIETLNEYGYEVLCDKGRTNRYYIGNRKFERTEIQILLNALSEVLSNDWTKKNGEKYENLKNQAVKRFRHRERARRK